MNRTFVLHLLDKKNGWRISHIAGDSIESHTIAISPDDDALSAMPEILEALRQMGYDRQDCLLSLPGSRTLTAAIDLLNLPRRHRRPAMIYRLEDQLPLEAENLTADFFPEIDGYSLAVAVETQPLKEIVEALTERGVEVAIIAPRSLLVLRYFIQKGLSLGRYLLVVDGSQADLLRLVGRTVTAWYTVEAAADDVIKAAEADLLLAPPVGKTEPTIYLTGELPADQAAEITAATGLPVMVATTESVDNCADLGAAIALAAGSGHNINLRRDSLAPTNLLQRLFGLLRAACLLLLTLAFIAATGLYWRSQQFAKVSDELEKRQTIVYQEAYPTGQLPPIIRARLQSELTRLSAVSGESLEINQQRDALDLLQIMTKNLPKEERYRLTSLYISQSSILLEGQATSHTTAERIATAMRQAGLEFDPPTTERLPKNIVGFTLSGKSVTTPSDYSAKPVAELSAAVAGKPGGGQ